MTGGPPEATTAVAATAMATEGNNSATATELPAGRRAESLTKEILIQGVTDPNWIMGW